MKAYIVGGGVDGTQSIECVYHLVTADGVSWASQWCHNFGQARRDLYEAREGLQADWRKKYGTVTVLRLGDDDMTFEDLVDREQNYNPLHETNMADGLYVRFVSVENGVKTKYPLRSVREMAAVMGDAMVSYCTNGEVETVRGKVIK